MDTYQRFSTYTIKNTQKCFLEATDQQINQNIPYVSLLLSHVRVLSMLTVFNMVISMLRYLASTLKEHLITCIYPNQSESE